ncbi:hypothetical protein DSECCO2_501050 [anaerobic digester metagenome]
MPAWYAAPIGVFRRIVGQNGGTVGHDRAVDSPKGEFFWRQAFLVLCVQIDAALLPAWIGHGEYIQHPGTVQLSHETERAVRELLHDFQTDFAEVFLGGVGQGDAEDPVHAFLHGIRALQAHLGIFAVRDVHSVDIEIVFPVDGRDVHEQDPLLHVDLELGVRVAPQRRLDVFEHCRGETVARPEAEPAQEFLARPVGVGDPQVRSDAHDQGWVFGREFGPALGFQFRQLAVRDVAVADAPAQGRAVRRVNVYAVVADPDHTAVAVDNPEIEIFGRLVFVPLFLEVGLVQRLVLAVDDLQDQIRLRQKLFGAVARNPQAGRGDPQELPGG